MRCNAQALVGIGSYGVLLVGDDVRKLRDTRLEFDGVRLSQRFLVVDVVGRFVGLVGS